jgi:hypothetical protein
MEVHIMYHGHWEKERHSRHRLTRVGKQIVYGLPGKASPPARVDREQQRKEKKAQRQRKKK